MFAALTQTPFRIIGRVAPCKFVSLVVPSLTTHLIASITTSFFTVATWGVPLGFFGGWLIWPAVDDGFKHAVSASLDAPICSYNASYNPATPSHYFG